MSRPGFRSDADVVEADGAKRLLIRNGTKYRNRIQRLPLGRYTVTVEKFVPNRSDDQNKYLHAGPLPILKREFGYDSIEDLKRDLMGECWGWKISPLTKQPVPIKPHTSEMTVDEFSHFIDWLIPWAMVKWNIRLPLPDEWCA